MIQDSLGEAEKINYAEDTIFLGEKKIHGKNDHLLLNW